MKYIVSFLLFLGLSFTAAAVPLAKPSLRDKIGQMLMIGFDGKTVNKDSPVVRHIQDFNIGGVILFNYDCQRDVYDKNIESPEQVRKLNQDLQVFTKKANKSHKRATLPLLISVDYEGGKVNRLSEDCGFPAVLSAKEVGEGSLKDANHQAKAMANTLKELGFNLNFAPVLDVNVNPDNPVIGKLDRSFSSDPTLVSSFAGAYSKQFLKQKVQCAYKHFPGHGSSTADSHLGFVDVTDTWQSYELEPYQNLLQQDYSCGAIMTAHIVNKQLDASGKPATLSASILQGLLRNQMQYNGVIITDDMQMKAISDHYGVSEAVELSINAGADMLLFGNNLAKKEQDIEELIDIIEAKVESGAISEERIDEAYGRIVALKKTLR